MAISETILIEALVQVGLMPRERLAELRQESRRAGLPLLETLCRAGRFSLLAAYRALAEVRGLAFYDREDVSINTGWLEQFSTSMLLKRLFLPVELEGELVVLSADPDDRMVLDIARRTLNREPRQAMAAPLMIEALLREQLQEYSETFNAVSILDDIMKEAWLRRATDLHFESIEHGMQLRMRVDGTLQHYDRPISKALADTLLSRIKVLAGLDIAEQFMAQDGGFAYVIDSWGPEWTVELRVATIPARFGERATLRILGQSTAGLNLSQLGMPKHLLGPMLANLDKPYGILLVTGPTGSGKSTTLYAALRSMDARRRNILTVEDPIEQVVEGISQVQVSSKVSFAKALRSFLRHDPDVMLVGEIRDHETAETAIRAAMTGHMVLSTLHTNNSVAAIGRLADIGCAPFLIASTLVGALAQRLLRRICSHCRSEYTASAEECQQLEWADEQPPTLYRGSGCSHCMGSGYSGRVGVYETLWLDRTLERLIHQKAEEDELRRHALENQLLNTLWEDARSKVLQGVTTLKEALPLYYA